MLKFLRFMLGAYLLVLVAGSLVWLGLWKTNSVKLYNVQTGSMAPALAPGDLNIVKTNPQTLRVGDVISYQAANNTKTVVSHRIYKLYPTKGYLVTKGDNLAQADPPVPYSAVIGVSVRAIPKLGYIFSFLHQPAGLIGLVYLPALLICAYELQRIASQFSYKAYSATSHL